MPASTNNGHSLKREMGLFTGILLVAGLLIGSGAFIFIVSIAKEDLGKNAILAVWIVAGIFSLLGALTIGGLASLSDASGGTYEYLRISFGKFYSFIYGWSDFMIIGTGVNAYLAFVFATTVNSVVHLPDPLQSLSYITIANEFHPFADSGIKILGIATIIILTGVNCFGTRESALLNNITTSVKVLGILLLIILGMKYSLSDSTSTEVIAESATTLSGWQFIGAFIASLVFALWAFDGWTYATNISGEIKNPGRNIPLALFFGILLVTCLYFLLNYVFINVIPLEKLKIMPENDIVAISLAKIVFGSFGEIFILVLIAFCVLSALNSSILSLPRRYYQMAHEGFFFQNAGKINKRFRTPVIALVYSMIWSCILLLLFGDFVTISSLVVFASFVFHGLLCVALFKMKGNGSIKVKVFGYPFAPILFLAFSIILTINSIWQHPTKSVIGLILILCGVPFYYYFKSRSIKGPLQ
jgi:basic amino acid/polyamine antiporter, APA family